MYNYPLYRPPSEGKSLILQITHGCSHNQCSFCNMYKSKYFYIKKPMEIEEHINWGKSQFGEATRIFLGDGNALVLNTDILEEILKKLYANFSKLQRVSTYGAPKDLLRKTPEELQRLKKAGLSLIYLGVESGSDTILKTINKGVTQKEMIEAGQKAVKAGFSLSCMVISGLGGKKMWEEHAVETAKVINSINPDYFSPLTLMVEQGTELRRLMDNGKFNLLEPVEILNELQIMLELLDLDNCLFTCNHASNYVPLKGVLNKDKEKLLNEIDNLKNKNTFKPEWQRGL